MGTYQQVGTTGLFQLEPGNEPVQNGTYALQGDDVMGEGVFPVNLVTFDWLTANDLPEYWEEAWSIDPKLRELLVEAARQQCADYLGPTLLARPSVESRDNWRLAHIMQVRALWNAQTAGGGDQVGPDGYPIRVYPMDRTVKALLRPRAGIPGFF